MTNMRRDPVTQRTRATSGGYASEVALRVVLLLIVFGELVFLASRYRVRVDLTGDKLYSLTDSTRQVLSGMEDRLLVECYFSKESRLPAALREMRRQLENLLDEYVQLSDGKVVLQKLDPQDDAMLKDKASRLGMRAIPVSDTGDASLSIRELWQGMRLLYGAEKQEVIDFFGFQQATALYEAELTPKIKALTVKNKTKVGMIAFATEGGPAANPFGGGGGAGKGYGQLAQLDGIKGRYDLQNIDLTQGQLVPDDTSTLLLIRPKNLTDRQKYAVDQFLMRGGNLVVFADNYEYEIGDQRSFRGRKVNYDAADAKLKFIDQLAHYGVKVEEKLVADALEAASRRSQFLVPRRTIIGNVWSPIPYPYWFQPLALDYAELADQFVLNAAVQDGNRRETVEQYRALFKPGADKSHDLLQGMNELPSFFWPCPIAVADKPPEGVAGRVILRTSPFSFAEEPPMDLNPLGWNRMDAQQQNESLRTFVRKINDRLRSEPRQQFGLMVELTGTFPSFFAGKEIPPRRTEDQNKPASPGVDPLQLPVQTSPVQTPPPPTAGEATGKTEAPSETPAAPAAPAAETPKAEEKKPGESGGQAPAPPAGKSGSGGDGGAAKAPAGQEPEKQEPGKQEPAKQEPAPSPAAPAPVAPEPQVQEPQVPAGTEPKPAAAAETPQGPPVPGEATAEDKDKDPPPILQAEKRGRLVVVGDSDFIRDDLIQNEYAQFGGPISPAGAVFFGNMMDGLAEDRDLLALRNKTSPDRSIQFVTGSPDDDPELREQQIAAAANFWRWANIIGPCVAILVVWLVTGLRRRARKQSFLTSVQV